jgi:alanyl-tRNA synthetase
MISGNDIRKRFLDYFAGRGHRVVKSSSLVPASDPTLLFSNAGMNQFKDVFLGLEKRPYTRAASSQKCVRAGGKHNDLENVGRTRRHHTFFEMLGNFSFGDYFKKEAIAYAWELVTAPWPVGYGLPHNRLYVTIFRQDDQAGELWQSEAGVPAGRIFRLDEKDNFWAMGETGPCGPCSEIHYDMGPEASDEGHADCPFPCECGRYVEIWNLVFMQFDRDASGKLTPLPRPSIDTGLGLERVAAVMQGVLSNFDTDLLKPLVDRAGEMARRAYGEDPAGDVSLRILADHSRAAAFLIHDGVLPANEGRGYVLRKILRRAVRHGRLLGLDKPFLYELTGTAAELMKEPYPELMESVPRVARVVKDEEQRFGHTLSIALREFERVATDAGAFGLIPGAKMFPLYDTFGLPVDLMEEIARERKLKLDLEGFEAEMAKQRERARASWKGGEKAAALPVYQELLKQGQTRFEGYDALECRGCRILAVIRGDQRVEALAPGERAEVVLDRTPFYAEAGGQVGDTGVLLNESGTEELAVVEDTQRPLSGLVTHRVLAQAPLRVGDAITASVRESSRRATMRNHTATHLMHAALRKVLGPHVKQAGSVVEPARLRFDFAHYAALDESELEEVERLVNEEILRNTEVRTGVMDLDQALATGAMALFGEKYGEQVRVVQVPAFSTELCGGTHVGRTGDIGMFKIVSESSISAGVRRIEAITGEAAYDHYRRSVEAVRRIQQMLRTNEPEVVEAVERVLQERRAVEKKLEQLRGKLATSQRGGLAGAVRSVKDVKVLSTRVEEGDRNHLRTLVDQLKAELKSGVVVVGAIEDGKAALVVGVTKDLTPRLHAGKIAQAVAQKLGGKGGGRPDMAEGGGNAEQLDAAISAVPQIVEQML